MGWSSSLSKAQTQCTTSILAIPCLFCPAGMYFEARRIHFRMFDHHTAFQDPTFSRRYWMLPLHTRAYFTFCLFFSHSRFWWGLRKLLLVQESFCPNRVQVIHWTSKPFEAYSPLDIINHDNITHAEKTVCHCSVAGAHAGFRQACNGIWMSVEAVSKHTSQTPSLARGGQVHTSARLCCLLNIPDKDWAHQNTRCWHPFRWRVWVLRLRWQGFHRGTPFCKPDHLSAVLLAIWAQMYTLNLLFFCLNFRLPITTSLSGMPTVLTGPGTDTVQSFFFSSPQHRNADTYDKEEFSETL